MKATRLRGSAAASAFRVSPCRAPLLPLQIVPIAMASRAVAFKHTAAGLYSEMSYVLAVMAGHLPISIVCDVLFATILYFIMGMATDAGRWALWVLIVFLMDLAISVMYRSFSYATPSQELAMIISSLFTAVSALHTLAC